MWIVEAVKDFFEKRDRTSVERMEKHSGEVKHDLTNLAARTDMISRLVSQMQEDGSRRK